MKPHMTIPLKLLIAPFKAANMIGWLLMTPKKKYFLLLLQKSICYSFSELTLVQFIITIKPLLLNVFKAALAGVLIMQMQIRQKNIITLEPYYGSFNGSLSHLHRYGAILAFIWTFVSEF